MLKNIEKKKELIEKRKFYLEQMISLSKIYDNFSEEGKEIIENILKKLGQISIIHKQEIDNLK